MGSLQHWACARLWGSSSPKTRRKVNTESKDDWTTKTSSMSSIVCRILNMLRSINPNDRPDMILVRAREPTTLNYRESADLHVPLAVNCEVIRAWPATHWNRSAKCCPFQHPWHAVQALKLGREIAEILSHTVGLEYEPCSFSVVPRSCPHEAHGPSCCFSHRKEPGQHLKIKLPAEITPRFMVRDARCEMHFMAGLSR